MPRWLNRETHRIFLTRRLTFERHLAQTSCLHISQLWPRLKSPKRVFMQTKQTCKQVEIVKVMQNYTVQKLKDKWLTYLTTSVDES